MLTPNPLLAPQALEFLKLQEPSQPAHQKVLMAFKNQPHLVASHQLSWQPCSLTCSSRNNNLQYKLATRVMKEELILYSMAWAKNLVREKTHTHTQVLSNTLKAVGKVL